MNSKPSQSEIQHALGELAICQQDLPLSLNKVDQAARNQLRAAIAQRHHVDRSTSTQQQRAIKEAQALLRIHFDFVNHHPDQFHFSSGTPQPQPTPGPVPQPQPQPQPVFTPNPPLQPNPLPQNPPPKPVRPPFDWNQFWMEWRLRWQYWLMVLERIRTYYRINAHSIFVFLLTLSVVYFLSGIIFAVSRSMPVFSNTRSSSLLEIMQKRERVPRNRSQSAASMPAAIPKQRAYIRIHTAPPGVVHLENNSNGRIYQFSTPMVEPVELEPGKYQCVITSSNRSHFSEFVLEAHPGTTLKIQINFKTNYFHYDYEEMES